MNDHPFPYDLTHTTMPDPMPPTQLTDAMLKKPGFSPSEWINAFRSLEEAAQGLRDRFERIGIAIREMQKDARTDYTLSSLAALDFKAIVAQLDGSDEALARFDALKEGK